MNKLFLFILLFFLIQTSAYAKAPTQFDHTIKKWSDIYLPLNDWRLYKAQLWAESNLKPNVRSPVGASGIAQFMPGTWIEVSKKLKLKGLAIDPDLAIQAGAYYQAQMQNYWKTPRPHEDRIKLGQASYNAGIGNILKAQKVSGNSIYYNDIISSLPKVTGHHSKETIGYVKKIWIFWQQMISGIL